MRTVPVTKFGKDHWSLLAYVETCCVDKCPDRMNPVRAATAYKNGQVSYVRMRVNERRHPMHKCASPFGGVHRWKPDYGTRLRGFFEAKGAQRKKLQISGHDDIDCLNDLERYGMVEWLNEANGFVQMTDKGLKICAALRRFKANGGQFAEFSNWFERVYPELYAYACVTGLTDAVRTVTERLRMSS